MKAFPSDLAIWIAFREKMMEKGPSRTQFVSSWKDLSKAHQVDQAWEMSGFSFDCKKIKAEPDKANVPHDV